MHLSMHYVYAERILLLMSNLSIGMNTIQTTHSHIRRKFYEFEQIFHICIFNDSTNVCITLLFPLFFGKYFFFRSVHTAPDSTILRNPYKCVYIHNYTFIEFKNSIVCLCTGTQFLLCGLSSHCFPHSINVHQIDFDKGIQLRLLVAFLFCSFLFFGVSFFFYYPCYYFFFNCNPIFRIYIILSICVVSDWSSHFVNSHSQCNQCSQSEKKI